MKNFNKWIILLMIVLLFLAVILIRLLITDGSKCINDPSKYYYDKLKEKNKPYEVNCFCNIQTIPIITTIKFNENGTTLSQGSFP